MPKDLPGFYYDAEKNRYFPIKGRIPGSSSSSSSKPHIPEPPKAVQSCSNSRVRTSKLLQIRELYGNVILSSKGKYNFAEEFQKRQASRPKIWRYHETRIYGETALERIPANVQMEDGVTNTEALLTGGKLGLLSITAVGKNPQDVDNGAQCLQPACVWPVADKENSTRCSTSSGFLWRNKIASIGMPSRISCIKRFRTSSASTVGTEDNSQHALITSLGSENSGGSIYVLDLKESIMDSHDPPNYFATHRIKRVASLDCTVWTGDCGPNRNKAVIGTNLGAALVDLESGTQTWVLRSRSDVLAQQFVCSGNAIICGLRNGAIVTVDPREKIDPSIRSRHTRLARHKISYSPINKASKPWFKLSGDIQSSRTITFPSSISSLAALNFDDQYFLASSMDGSVKLYDHRLIKRGHVQSYDGHVNSHSHIQLGIDPSEKLVMSGGEDSYLRIWSIKSGELIFQEKFADTVLSTVSWRGERREYSGEDSCGTGAWLGSEAGLFYTQFS